MAFWMKQSRFDLKAAVASYKAKGHCKGSAKAAIMEEEGSSKLLGQRRPSLYHRSVSRVLLSVGSVRIPFSPLNSESHQEDEERRAAAVSRRRDGGAEFAKKRQIYLRSYPFRFRSPQRMTSAPRRLKIAMKKLRKAVSRVVTSKRLPTALSVASRSIRRFNCCGEHSNRSCY